MKKAIFFTAVLVFTVAFFASNVNAQTIGKGNGKGIKTNWVDKNGDGICDNAGTGKGTGKGKGYGKKDGTGNPLRPMDGSGYGKKAGAGNCTGVCDGTGTSQQGTMARKGKR